MTAQLETPREGYDEHKSKSPLSVKPRFIEPVGERINFRRLKLPSFATAPDNGALSRAWLCTSSNVEPAHKTTKYFVPTYSEVVNLTGLL
jgi:hypothetical protein